MGQDVILRRVGNPPLSGAGLLPRSGSMEAAEAMPVAFYLYVPDADATYRQAVEAGAKPLYPPADQPYGDRAGGVEDAWGNTWYIASHLA